MMGPPSKEKMLETTDMEVLHEEIAKYWDELLAAAPPNCSSACEAKAASLTRRLQESQEHEKKLLDEMAVYKAKLVLVRRGPPRWRAAIVRSGVACPTLWR